MHNRTIDSRKEDKPRYIIYDYSKISGTGEAPSWRQRLVDNVQGFDTKWDEVLLSMTKVLGEEILEFCNKNRFKTGRNWSLSWHCICRLGCRKENGPLIVNGDNSFVSMWSKIGIIISMPATKTGLFKWQQRTGNPRGNPNVNGMDTRKDRNIGDLCSMVFEWSMFAPRFVQLEARFWQKKKGTEEYPVLLPTKREGS